MDNWEDQSDFQIDNNDQAAPQIKQPPPMEAETLSLIILIAAISKTTREDTTEEWGAKKVFL